MRNFNMKMVVYRRSEGATNPSGEPVESWPAVSGESSRSVNISPLSVSAQAAMRTAEPGLIKMSSHLVLCQRDADIQVDDRLEDTSGNSYVVQSVEPHRQHLKIKCSVTGIA